MGTRSTVAIDPVKMNAILDEKKLTKAEAARRMGYTENLLCNSQLTKKMSAPVLFAFTSLTGTTYDDLKPDEPAEKPKQEKAAEVSSTTAQISTDDIQHAVYKGISSAMELYKDNIYETIARACAEAVFNGIQQAVGRYKSEAMKDMRGAIYSGMYQANKQYQEDVKNAAVREGWRKAE